MKCCGKILEYNGNIGNIIGIDGKYYMFVDTDLVDKDINKDDYVSFDAEVYKDIELTRNMARFVKKINRDDIKD